jgi:hypothetical protein
LRDQIIVVTEDLPHPGKALFQPGTFFHPVPENRALRDHRNGL